MKKVPEKQVMTCYLDLKNCFITASSKMIDKSPLKYNFVRILTCLDLRIVIADRIKVESNFKRELHKLNDLQYFSELECEKFIKEFFNFMFVKAVIDKKF